MDTFATLLTAVLGAVAVVALRAHAHRPPPSQRALRRIQRR